MTLKQHKKGVDDGKGTCRELKDVLCYQCNLYGHHADQCSINDNEVRKSQEANTGARYQEHIKRAAKRVIMMHAGSIEEDHASGDDKFEDDKYVEDNNADNNVQLLFNIMDRRGNLNQIWVLLENQSTMHMFYNRNLLCNIRPDTNPVDIHSSSGINHYNMEGTIPDFGKA